MWPVAASYPPQSKKRKYYLLTLNCLAWKDICSIGILNKLQPCKINFTASRNSKNGKWPELIQHFYQIPSDFKLLYTYNHSPSHSLMVLSNNIATAATHTPTEVRLPCTGSWQGEWGALPKGHNSATATPIIKLIKKIVLKQTFRKLSFL